MIQTRKKKKKKKRRKKKKMENKGDKSSSSFSNTCRLLSQLLKEKRGFAGLHTVHAQVKSPTTMKLLPGLDVLGEEDATRNSQEQSCTNYMDLFPKHSGFDHSDVLPNITSEIKKEEKGQLTIFYGGRGLVFDNFPADKAMNLIQMAGKESTSFSKPHTSAPAGDDDGASGEPPLALPPDESFAKANASDMPIARRNSLHRFLEKRKDRISTKAPYQLNDTAAALASTSGAKADSIIQSWLNLGSTSDDVSYSRN
ncbi:protein TIFY 10b-like [Canna indica]|uniref:Protein TIFY n=1 Tax=Canna indica TaxID=4628 RepID=A0AAQ3KRI4_9LILI|nr:protein TIFY 10b-like [Canna indica]